MLHLEPPQPDALVPAGEVTLPLNRHRQEEVGVTTPHVVGIRRCIEQRLPANSWIVFSIDEPRLSSVQSTPITRLLSTSVPSVCITSSSPFHHTFDRIEIGSAGEHRQPREERLSLDPRRS